MGHRASHRHGCRRPAIPHGTARPNQCALDRLPSGVADGERSGLRAGVGVAASILVVEDDPTIRLLLGDLLRDEGFEVRSAADEGEALRVCLDAPPDLMLLDFNSASGLASALKRSQVPLFPIVAFVADADLRQAVRRGRYAEARPSEIVGLLRSVRNLLSAGSDVRGRTRPSLHANRGGGMQAGRRAFLDHVRRVSAIEPAVVTAPFRSVDDRYLDGFRRLLGLQESDPDAIRQLTTILVAAEPDVAGRLERVDAGMDDHLFRSLQEVVARRSYRRIHSAALGAGAAIMWSFPGSESDRQWKHANATGVLAQLLVEHDPYLRDRAFAAALLHDLGRFAQRRLEREEAHTAALPYDAYYADAVGKAIVGALGLPAWLRESLVPCGLPPHPSDRLAVIVSASCAVANAHGLAGLDAVDGRHVDPELSSKVEQALDRAGGREWLEARIHGPLLAARAGLRAALAVA